MDYLVDDYDQALNPLRQCKNVSSNLIDDLWLVLYKLHRQKRFSQPMPTIGMYIAVASLCCILAMVTDLILGLKNRKLWLPCKYFTLNSASLTVIAAAVKLPLDLNNPMPGAIDQQAKLGSVAFMCIMMNFLLPSLATMKITELVTNTIALGVLVITLVVNVCIQINTGLISNSEDMHIKYNMGGHTIKSKDMFGYANREIAIIYVAMLLMSLMIYISLALMISKARQYIESKYQEVHERDLIFQQHPVQLTVEQLKQRVITYGIMADTSTPQLLTVCSATSSASAVICVSISLLHLIKTFNNVVNERRYKAYDSDYKGSTLVILVIQSIGIALGAIALFCRFFAPIPFTIKEIWKVIKFYEVESYWTHTLSDWKHNRLYSSSSPYFNFVFYKLQRLGLTLLTVSQKAIVITCKAIRMIPVLIPICVFCCYVHLVQSVFIGLISPFAIESHRRPNMDFYEYFFQPQDHMKEVAQVLNLAIKSVGCLIQKAEKQQPKNLKKLLEKSSGFEGVGKFDNNLVPILSTEYQNCWSLPVVTLTTIVVSLPNFQKYRNNFLESVSEALRYVALVEESVNATSDYVRVQKAAKNLWQEVAIYHKWLGHKLDDSASEVSIKDILRWFRNAANDVGITHIGVPNDDSICRVICANSMYQITKTIMDSYKDNIHQVGKEDLFAELSSMISDIVAACLTNLPHVIALKCHTSERKKREECVHSAAALLGKTSEIIILVQNRGLPSLNPEEFPFIDKWRKHLMACDFMY